MIWVKIGVPRCHCAKKKVRMNKGLDIMLRASPRCPACERSLKTMGYEIIVPPKRRKGPDPNGFQISLGTMGRTFDEGVCAAAKALRRLSAEIRSARTKYGVEFELDFGVDSSIIPFMTNHRFSPTFLRLVGSLGIELNLSVYARPSA